MKRFSIAIHGGAGTISRGKMSREKEQAYTKALEEALQAGASVLKNNGTALAAVEKAVIALEDSPLFNAGRGSVFTADGTHEMDASIMDGQDLKCGAVSLITGIKNPISLARDVMQNSGHVFLAGEGAMKFAKKIGYKCEEASYFFDEFRYRQWQKVKGSDSYKLDHSETDDTKFGTVGAVCCDLKGNLAAATSTGGMTNKKWGRIGDSPVIGAGTYADNKTCAVSCTGSGEFFIRGVTAYDVSCLMKYKNISLAEAASKTIHEHLPKIGGDGGLIAVDSQGNVVMPFNTEGMYRGVMTSDGKKQISIYKD
ncbi:MAG TPA: isoaspartyl peptidase/L-asparaginase [Flavobacteriaceae bacterium]|nr:isoaspartyl peptidase/L-asparaginase [Flavobacteriaceae bacterium]